MRTFSTPLWGLGDFHNHIRNGICCTNLLGNCSRNLPIGRCVINFLHDRLGYRGTSWGDRSIICSEHDGGAAAAKSIRHYFDLVWDGVLSPLLVCFCAWHFAVGSFVVDSLDSGHRDGRGGIGPVFAL
jgi:hypothetical protein